MLDTLSNLLEAVILLSVGLWNELGTRDQKKKLGKNALYAVEHVGARLAQPLYLESLNVRSDYLIVLQPKDFYMTFFLFLSLDIL